MNFQINCPSKVDNFLWYSIFNNYFEIVNLKNFQSNIILFAKKYIVERLIMTQLNSMLRLKDSIVLFHCNEF